MPSPTDSVVLNTVSQSISSINGIISQEQTRLNQKQAAVKTAQDNQNRLVALNQNYSSRTQQYIKMVLLLVAVLLAILALKYLDGVIPPTVNTLLGIVVVSVGIIYMFILYEQLRERDNIDYNQLVFSPPKKKDLSGNDLAKNSNIGDLIGSIDLGECIGPACCASGTIWDVSSQTCIVKTKEPFTMYRTNESFSTYKTKPYTDYEFDSYSSIM
jgi:hypothetical protein